MVSLDKIALPPSPHHPYMYIHTHPRYYFDFHGDTFAPIFIKFCGIYYKYNIIMEGVNLTTSTVLN